MKKGLSLQQMMLDKLDIHMQKNEYLRLERKYKTIYKVNSKWIKGLTIWPKIVELLEENIAKEEAWHQSGQSFFRHDTRRAGDKNKNRGMRFDHTKRLLHSKGNNRMKRQPTKWEKIFANYI